MPGGCGRERCDGVTFRLSTCAEVVAHSPALFPEPLVHACRGFAAATES